MVNFLKKKTKNKKVVRIKNGFKSQNFIYTKRLKTIFVIMLVIFILLISRIGYLQFAQGSYLSELAYTQQAINQIISPKRGSIFDSTGNVLSQSISVDTITINPEKLKSSNKSKESDEDFKKKIAKAFSDIFKLDYKDTLKKVNSDAQVETIVKKVEKEKVDKLKTWMDENDVSIGINIDEDTKRYYPHNNVLSQVIGFCR